MPVFWKEGSTLRRAGLFAHMPSCLERFSTFRIRSRLIPQAGFGEEDNCFHQNENITVL